MDISGQGCTRSNEDHSGKEIGSRSIKNNVTAKIIQNKKNITDGYSVFLR